MFNTYHFCWLAFVLLISACSPPVNKTIGQIEQLDPELNKIVSSQAKIEILADGFDWSEGPLWIESEKMLLFSDVPRNTIFKWTQRKGAEVYLTPSGFTGSEIKSKEPGSNGLLLDAEGNLVLCQHGDRRVALMKSAINQPQPNFVSIANTFEDSRFNSPNDAIFYNGNLYFTDPPYGLALQVDDPEKEIPFQGIYKVSSTGVVSLLVDSLSRPNGVAFTPDGKMRVANSDPKKAIWYEYTLIDSAVVSGRVYYDASNLTDVEIGLPDGLKIDSNGNMYATGPGGVWIFNPEGKILGRLKIPVPTSNCALSPDEKTLYITADMYVLRIKLRD